PLYETEQDPIGQMNVWMSQARLEAGQNNILMARQLFESVFALAEKIKFSDHPVIQGARREYDYLIQGNQSQADDTNDNGSKLQALADLLIGWIETGDWAASQTYLTEHTAHLLTAEAVQALELLQRANPQVTSIPQHLALLQRCRELGIEAAYQELNAALAAAQNPARQAMQALLQVIDNDSFAAAIEAHPMLKELPMLQQLAGAIQQAHRDNQPALAQHWLALLLTLLRIYNYEHTEQIDAEAQGQFIELHEILLPVAEALDETALADGLRETCGWALNTLGNHYAQQGDHAQAVESYSRAVAHAPQNAMLYRNRAGEYLDLQQVEAARQDIEQAAALEPDAARLPQLWRDLYLALGDGPAMLPYAQQWVTANPEEIDPHFYLALAQALAGDRPAAAATITAINPTCSDEQRETWLDRLARLEEQHPALAPSWQALATILQNKSTPTEEVP
ncbi:MAG: tetratricopeptide repeat protein, partial [Anaerolineae bacterium]|nr:tetratricopeptide repeat protein [Anaerolineae bacterium]